MTTTFFTEIEKIIKTHGSTKDTKQLKQREYWWNYHPTWFQVILSSIKPARNWQKTHRDQCIRTRDPGQPQRLICDKYTKSHIGGRGSISTNAFGKTACPNVNSGIRALSLTQLKNSRAGNFPLRLFFGGVGTQLQSLLGVQTLVNQADAA